MRDEVRGKKRKGVGCCVEHGIIDHLACGITYNASHLCMALEVCGAGSVHRQPADRVSERARRALGSEAVGLLLRVIVVRPRSRSCIARRLVLSQKTFC